MVRLSSLSLINESVFSTMSQSSVISSSASVPEMVMINLLLDELTDHAPVLFWPENVAVSFPSVEKTNEYPVHRKRTAAKATPPK